MMCQRLKLQQCSERSRYKKEQRKDFGGLEISFDECIEG